MTVPVDFYFEFGSPYGYFASLEVDDVVTGAGRRVAWKPIMLGPVFKLTGAAPLATVPLKGAYSLHDWDRLGRLLGVPWVMPDPFPVVTLAAARAFYWLDSTDPERARAFARAIYHRYFGEGHDVSAPDAVADVGESLGIDRVALLEAIGEPRWKTHLKEQVETAIERGVCGSPFFIADGEGFWGWDRLPMLRRWLVEGGW